MKYEMCDHYWEYINGTKEGVNAECTKCKQVRKFTWFDWKSLTKESKKLGTTKFH